MDEERTPAPDAEQVESAERPDPETRTLRRGMFDTVSEADARDEMRRFARKRAAIWGLAAGGVMSLILVLCAVLLYMLGTS